VKTVAELSSLSHGDYLVANQTPNDTFFSPLPSQKSDSNPGPGQTAEHFRTKHLATPSVTEIHKVNKLIDSVFTCEKCTESQITSSRTGELVGSALQ
jgi:hypothetical protein